MTVLLIAWSLGYKSSETNLQVWNNSHHHPIFWESITQIYFDLPSNKPRKMQSAQMKASRRSSVRVTWMEVDPHSSRSTAPSVHHRIRFSMDMGQSKLGTLKSLDGNPKIQNLWFSRVPGEPHFCLILTTKISDKNKWQFSRALKFVVWKWECGKQHLRIGHSHRQEFWVAMEKGCTRGTTWRRETTIRYQFWDFFFKMTIVIEQFLNMSKPSLIWIRNYNMYCLKDRALLQVTEHLSAICNSNELWKPRTIKWSEPDEVHWSRPTERYFMISILKTPITMPSNANWLATELNLRTNQCHLSKDMHDHQSKWCINLSILYIYIYIYHIVKTR